MSTIPTQTENPKGLHARYYIQKVVPVEQEFMGLPADDSFKLVPVDENSEYFVMRLDTGGSDLKHIAACRIGIHAYADAIQNHLPELATDLRNRYPLLSTPLSTDSKPVPYIQGEGKQADPTKMAIELFFENRKLHQLLADICGCGIYSDIETYKKFAPKSYHGTLPSSNKEGEQGSEVLVEALQKIRDFVKCSDHTWAMQVMKNIATEALSTPSHTDAEGKGVEAIEFAEWIVKDWYAHDDGISWYNYKKTDRDGCPTELIGSEQLYKLFKTKP